MRHAFVPHHAAPYRCAKCLRMLDCAPHLPSEPRAMTPAQILGFRKGTTNGTRYLGDDRLGVQRRAPAVSRAAR